MEINGFIVKNWASKLIRHPTEDAFSYYSKEKLIAVANGITRDNKDGTAAVKKGAGIYNTIRYYPRPSPAISAAGLACNIFLGSIDDFSPENRNQDAIKESLKRANEAIGRWNEIYKKIMDWENFDYLAHDFPACVVSAMTLRKQDRQNILSYGYIADCGVALFDKNGNLKFRTPNDMNEIEGYVKSQKDFNWKNSESRKWVRSHLRNNPEQKPSYGALTGEDWSKIKPYLRTGSFEAKPKDSVVVYSDGLENIIFCAGDVNSDFAERIRQRNFYKLKELCQKKVKTEGTLVLGKI